MNRMMPQSQKLWNPSERFINESNLTTYENWLEENYDLRFSSYEELWKWSVENIDVFWESLWKYFDIISYSDYSKVTSTHKMPGVKWFEGATLNYSEHIFRMKSADRPALIFATETGEKAEMSWSELEQKVASVRAFLEDEGVGKGDRVAAYIPNIPEAIIIFLAANSLGAIWSCCSPDLE